MAGLKPTTILTVLVAAAAGVGGWLGVRAIRRRLTTNSAILNETLPINSKWWRDQAKLEGHLLYAALGDSAAQGIGASAPKRGYVGVIASHVRALSGDTVQVANLSVSGATTFGCVQDQLPRFQKLEPDLVTVAIGANDIADFDPEAFGRNIRKVFTALPGHAIVADIPYFFLPWNEKKVAVANRILRQAAAESSLIVVPLHEAMKRQGLRGIVTQFAIDLFHPNDHGYRVWASAFLPTVTASLVERFPMERSSAL